MPRFELIEAKPYHVGAILRRMRIEHREAVERSGMNAHRELRSIYDNSCVRRALLIDGNLAALGGVSGSQLSPLGFAWVVLSTQALRYPLQIVKETRRQLRTIMETKRELATTVIGGDRAALRFAIFLGFHVQDEGPGAPAHSKAARRDLARFIENNPDLRLPVGSGYVIGMGYHGDAA